MIYLLVSKRTTGTTEDALLKEKNQTNVVQRIIPYYLFVYISFAVISLFILREKSLSEREILDNKNFYKIINQSKFLFTTLTRLCCLKH